jgi:hypothetical protein
MRVVFRLAYCVVFALAHYVVHILAYYVELKLAFSADDRRASTALLYQTAEKTAQIAGRQRLPPVGGCSQHPAQMRPRIPFPAQFRQFNAQLCSTPSRGRGENFAIADEFEAFRAPNNNGMPPSRNGLLGYRSRVLPGGSD